MIKVGLDYSAFVINNYMRAPNNKPTEKTEKRLSQNHNLSSDTKYIELDINTLIQQMFNTPDVKNEITKQATKRLNTQQSATMVKNILSEYFNSFMLLGYGVDGDRVIIKNTTTDMEEDSLVELVRYVFMRMMQGS